MRKHLLTIAMLLCVSLVKAQWLPVDVVPAQRGTLPAIDQSALPQEPTVQPVTLFLSRVTAWTVDAVPQIYAELHCTFNVEAYGATSMSLEERLEGQDNWVVHTSDIKGGLSIPIKSTREYRLKLNDGPRQGECSNVVKAEMPKLYTKFNGYTDGRDENVLVDEPIQATIDLRMRALDYHGGNSYDKSKYTDYNDDNGYFRYRWYRMNPYTCEMNPIEGAEQRYYTPTMADLGYTLLQRISGDDVHCSFDLYEQFGVVDMAVQASIAAAANDGFVINTNYDLPDAASKLMLYGYDMETGEGAVIPAQIVTRKAGQYAFKCDAEKFVNGMVDFNAAVKAQGYKLWMRMERMGFGGNSYRELMLDERFAKMPMAVGAKFEGNVLPTTLELYASNLFSEGYTLAETVEFGADAESGMIVLDPIFKNEYLLLAKGTAQTDPTYYPNVVAIDQAIPVVNTYMDWFDPQPFIVEAQPVGTIEASVAGVKAAPVAPQSFFSLDGRKGRVHGLNIVRMADGTVKKVIVK